MTLQNKTYMHKGNKNLCEILLGHSSNLPSGEHVITTRIPLITIRFKIVLPTNLGPQ